MTLTDFWNEITLKVKDFELTAPLIQIFNPVDNQTENILLTWVLCNTIISKSNGRVLRRIINSYSQVFIY